MDDTVFKGDEKALRELLRGMLVVDPPSRRLSAEEGLKTSFFASISSTKEGTCTATQISCSASLHSFSDGDDTADTPHSGNQLSVGCGDKGITPEAPEADAETAPGNVSVDTPEAIPMATDGDGPGVAAGIVRMSETAACRFAGETVAQRIINYSQAANE